MNELDSEHSVHPLLSGRWKKALIDGVESLFEGKKGRKQDDEFDREVLEKKIGRPTVEIDFLKKNWATDCRGEQVVDRRATHRIISCGSMQAAECRAFQLLLT